MPLGPTFKPRALGVLATALVPLLATQLSGCGQTADNDYQGYVEGEFVYLAASQPGRLDHLAVQRGQQVAAATPLFALESENEAAAQRQAQQQLNAAKAQLDDIKTGRRPQEIAVQQAQLAEAQATQKLANSQLTRDEAQFQTGGIARAQLDQTRANAESANARVRELQNNLTVSRLPNREAQIGAQTAQVAAAQAALDQANWRLNQKAVAAPQAALVFDTLYRVGEWVPAGSPVLSLLPPGNIKVRFFVPETELGKLQLNQNLSLHCDGCGNDIPAKITYISTQSEYTPPVIYSNESRSKLVYMIEAHPAPEQATRLHPGQPLEVLLK